MKIYIKASVNTSPTDIAKTIQRWSERLSKDPVGNQNCMLCTWAAEQRFRGLDALPRAVYSPRDPIFNINPNVEGCGNASEFVCFNTNQIIMI